MKRKAKKKSWKQGLYTPVNPEKYKGDVTKIMLRSSWEENFAKFLDGNKNVIEWASEAFAIKYFNPHANRPAKYYPDFWVKFQDANGDIQIEVIEVKPYKQVQRPKGGNKYEMQAWTLNQCKWEAAIKFCAKHRIKFRVLTERSIFK